ncbi:succinyl-diaminopimelate desuccinylase DapE [Spirochaetota bacterium]|nr:succinyl-diaminopimelate desuccinylase DapE [Spirochaetota bacterium]
MLLEICNIPSPSHGEAPLTHHILTKLAHTPQLNMTCRQLDNSFIILPKSRPSVVSPPMQRHSLAKMRKKRPTKRPHIAIVGHLDVVPAHFLAQFKQNRVYGAGASDMKAGIAVMITMLTEIIPKLATPYQLSFIFYDCEEVADMRTNGLYRLIRKFPAYFKSIDLAIVAEPTDNTIQLGCVGSYHAEVIFKGKRAHSARPWDGSNALSRASTFIRNISMLKPKKRRLWGVDFFDVISITESASEPGKTTLPAWWKANVNFRCTPYYSKKAAIDRFKYLLQQAGAVRENSAQFNIWSRAPAGSVIQTALFDQIIDQLDRPKAAKQAWTDVAQLSALNIPAFNYGPGSTAQCHLANEYVPLNNVVRYTQNLIKVLFPKTSTSPKTP